MAMVEASSVDIQAEACSSRSSVGSTSGHQVSGEV